ncbi:Methyltransferase domain-containing protein [Nocardioides scoriae]|uniref:Methyltransferase domain-containing protein n=1 Tax=Nocardioides scoriae TaxID=642780 RepID=A0A1H1TW65_9ACTN|nr:class I SAM-dependent methyltransferase [Nocardioides scoriae]SDS64450.1 Methyltransferase domain-containing protein [Nocardioides scoriae]
MTTPDEGPDLAPGAMPSPNIWHHTDVYEIENRAVDRAGAIESAMRGLADWAGRDLLDVGCGTGFHLPLFARTAATVTGVEPHGDLAAVARLRTRRLAHVRVLHGSATALPLADGSVDVVHARWAYFFGPGCEPGLAELDRVVRPGGRAFVVDNDPTRSTFGAWFRRGYPMVDPDEVVAFWEGHGWERHPVDMAWTFDAREDLEAVVRIEFAPEVAEEVLASHAGTEVDYAVNLWSRAF